MAFERRGVEDGLGPIEGGWEGGLRGLGGVEGGWDGGLGGEGDGGEGGGELTLEPGTFVELRRSTTAVNAVVLAASYTSSYSKSSSSSSTSSSSSKTSPSSKTSSSSTPSKTSSSSSKTSRTSGLTYLSLTSTGEVWPHTKDDVYFSVPGVVARDVVRMCGGEDDDVPEIATTKPQLHARVLVLKTLRQIQRDVEDAMNTLLSRQVDLYALTRAVNPEVWGETTLGEVGRVFGRKKTGKNGNTTFAQVFAAHKYIVANPRWFVLAHDYATSRRIRVRPKGDVERLKWVEGVVRDHGHEMDEFISLCQSIISTSPPHLLSPPLSFTSSTERKWSPSAQVFIRHLIKSLKPQHPAQIDPYLLGVQYIVKKVYPEVDDVFDEVVHRLLVDIGAVAPWQDVTTLRAMSEGELFLGDPPTTTTRTPPSPNAPLGPEDFYPTDPAHHIRHDFGDLPVYVIDDTNAQELDDGISVEPHPTSPSKIWIHIHIADPTSLLPPTHALAKHAEKMTESMYFVQGACPMLPRSFTHDERKGFSLGCTGAEQRTLTFSVLVDVDGGGEIREYKVRAGVVRNFVVASYGEVDRVLGFGEEKWEKPFTAEEVVTPPNPSLTHLEPHVPNLQTLYTASQAFVARRFKDGVFTQSRPVSKLTGVVWPHTTPVVGFPVINHDEGGVEAYTYTGYPFFSSPSPTPYLSQYQTSAQHLLDTHSRSLVAECMKLASRACSMFCRDHSIPILRRWAEPPVLDTEEGLGRVVGARRGRGGYLENGYTILATHLLSDSTAGYTLDLRGHWCWVSVPHEGYVRCTSPLRRLRGSGGALQVKSALVGVAGSRSRTPSTSLSSSLTPSPSPSSPSSPSPSSPSPSSPSSTPASPTSSPRPKLPLPNLPFSPPHLLAFATHNQAAERFRKRIAGQHEAWWGVAWLMRYLEVVQFLERGGRYRFTASAVVRNDENNGFGSAGSRLESGSLNRHLPDFPSAVFASNSFRTLTANNPFPTLTATLTSPPETNRDSKKLQAAVYLTRLGIKAVLTEGGGGRGGGGGGGTPYNIADLRVGDTVPVEVNAMRLGVRPQVQVVPRRG
ncbi:RNB-domain-containing protein [Lentinula edodes]|uniref:RNB-domain-containing protein n=1 Tax=Lentinula edodes TaxID=5353 RepID=A0A1Q3EF13_LENED|nr:RNB-domain-containing protein [Lentinula edodes]